MATRPVRIELQCQKATLKFTHNLPSLLITSNVLSRSDPAWTNTFISAMKPLVNEHQQEGLKASDDKCGVCGAKAVTVTMTPMSFLHQVDDPFINIYVHPICSKGECDIETRQEISDVMRTIAESDEPMRSAPGGEAIPGTEGNGPREVGMCRVCKKTEGVKKCARCGAVAYCGKEHQLIDWKRFHKAICKKPGE